MQANIADLFLEETLKKSVKRLRETDPDEETITLAELKKRCACAQSCRLGGGLTPRPRRARPPARQPACPDIAAGAAMFSPQ